MRIGAPKEVKTHEYRVGLVPGSVRELLHHGHQIVVEKGAGTGIGIDDAEYVRAGATIAGSAAEIFASADMIVKVKEPQPAENAMLRSGQVLFTYLHLAADKGQTEGLLRSGATCIAYETVTDARGGLPLLAPMSEVAGRMSVQVGAHCLVKEQGGKGWRKALQDDAYLRRGLNVHGGAVTFEAVAADLNLPLNPIERVLAA